MKNKYIKLTKKDIGKQFEMYWCGHWNRVFIRDIRNDTFYGVKNGHVYVYNVDLESRTVIPNEFNENELKRI